MELKFNEKEFLEMAVERIVGEVSKHDLMNFARAELKKSLDTMIILELKPKVSEALSKALEDAMTQVITPVDMWGETVGEPTTIRGELTKQAKEFWEARVDRHGQFVDPKTYGWNQAQSRAQYLMAKYVADTFAEDLKQHANNIMADVKDALKLQLGELVNTHVDNLIKVTRAKK